MNYENEERVAWRMSTFLYVVSFGFVPSRSRSVQLHFAPLAGVRSNIVKKSNLSHFSHDPDGGKTLPLLVVDATYCTVRKDYNEEEQEAVRM